MRKASTVPVALICVATVAYPCGGSEVYNVDGPLVPTSGGGATASQRRAAVRDADRAYRGLLDTDPRRPGEGFWADSLPRSVEAQVIGRAWRH